MKTKKSFSPFVINRKSLLWIDRIKLNHGIASETYIQLRGSVLGALQVAVCFSIVTQSAWAQEGGAEPEDPTGSALFSESDLVFPEMLINRLVNDSDEVSSFIWNEFSLASQDILIDPDSLLSEELTALIDELNALLQGSSLYDEQRFEEVALSSATTELLAQNPQDDDLILLNRFLLEETYPLELLQYPLPPSGPAVMTNQSDYAPGSTALIQGFGFQSGETVDLQVTHADETPNTGEGHDSWTALAQNEGSFTTSWYVCEDDCLDATLQLTATGASSGIVATTMFTDSLATPIYEILRSLDATGYHSFTRLVQGTDGMFYGTTFRGGASNTGTVYKINSDGTGFTILHSFSSSATEPQRPWASLMEGSDGAFYGTSFSGGAYGRGTIYKINPDGTGFTTLYSFSPTDGRSAYAGVVQGADGTLYGTTQSGGAEDRGIVYKISSDGTGFTILYSFSNSTADGNYPYYHGVVQGSDGALYGTTYRGGTHYRGTVFKINTDGSGFTTLHAFTGSTADGQYPQSGLVEGSDGAFYGMTANGGAHNRGTVFKINTDGSGFTTLYSFSTSSIDGRIPYSELEEGTDGMFYGATYLGGSYDKGSVFRINSDGSGYTQLLSFSFSTADGTFPYSGVVQGSDGEFYGTTYRGGANDRGTIYRLNFENNVPPVADAGPDQSVESGVLVTLNGSGSSDPDGEEDIVSYEWTEGATPLGSGVTLDVPLSPGIHQVTLTVTDAAGLYDTDIVQITVEDTTPPEIVLNGPPTLLLECGIETYIELEATVSEGCDPEVALVIGGDTVDANTPGVYAVTYDAIDSCGNAAIQLTRTVTVADTIAPVITLNGAASVALECSIDTYTELGASVSDACDPGVTVVVGGDAVDASSPGIYLVTYDASDASGNAAIQLTRTVTVADTIAPVITLNGAASVALECAIDIYTELGAGVSEACDLSVSVVVGGDTVNANALGDYVVTYDATDASGNAATQLTRTVTVQDTIAPMITILAPDSGYVEAVDNAVPFAADIEEVCGLLDAVWVIRDFDDQVTEEWSASVAGLPGSGYTVDDVYSFAATGIYSITLIATDTSGNESQTSVVTDEISGELPAFVVIYDPSAGFVTGGGWIFSPEGALHPDLEEFDLVAGKATFGFVAKYKKGANVPTGNTEFQFKAGDLNFKSTEYQWLVVAGARAQYKGVGTINGYGGYGFMLTGIDGQVNGGGGDDRLRLKIWDTVSDVMIYDNQAGASDTAELDDATLVIKGNIVIHKKK